MGGIGGGRTGGPASRPVVRYEYAVGPRTYEGNRVTFNGQIGIGLRRVKQEVEWFASSKSIDVWYDPAQPERSVLEPGADGWNYGCTGVGVILTAIFAHYLFLPA